jgi:hypothetical protein
MQIKKNTSMGKWCESAVCCCVVCAAVTLLPQQQVHLHEGTQDTPQTWEQSVNILAKRW